jgi:DnaJ-class molecular chaperone
MKDYYNILDVPANADQETIKANYRKLARKWHPDLNQETKELAEVNMKLINEAYEVLGDPAKRLNYDLARMPKVVFVPSAWGFNVNVNTASGISWSASWGTAS